MAGAFPCSSCLHAVLDAEEALECSQCHQWQHRRCGTGISKALYDHLMQLEAFFWLCTGCEDPAGAENAVALSPVPAVDPAPQEAPAAELDPIVPNADHAADDAEPAAVALAPQNHAVFMHDLPPYAEQDPALEISVAAQPAEIPRARSPPPQIFELFPGMSTKGGDVLVQYVARDLGYQLCKKKQANGTTYYTCPVRNNHINCHGSALCRPDGAFEARVPHICEPVNFPGQKRRVAHDVKSAAKRFCFSSARVIAEERVSEHPAEVQFALSSSVNLAQQANRARREQRPVEPVNLHDFVLNQNHLPAQFTFSDIVVPETERRHFMFLTDTQRQLLATRTILHCDGTFKVVKPPFIQLYSIHGCIRRDSKEKMVPLCFFLMSGKALLDYQACFSRMKQLVANEPVEFLLDFEAAAWQALSLVYPAASLHGCFFHFCQAVFRRIQAVGLQQVYCTDAPTRLACRMLLSVPCLPPGEMEEGVRVSLQNIAEQRVNDLGDYVRDTWLRNPVWTPASISVFRRSVRTNNAVEGWHSQLNQRAQRPNLNFYLLLELLATEADRVGRTLNNMMNLGGTGGGRHHQRYVLLNERFLEFCRRFNLGVMPVETFLRSCSHLHKQPGWLPLNQAHEPEDDAQSE